MPHRSRQTRKPAPTQTPRCAPYFNRELSWLAFNRRVLEQAQSTRHPLLERVKLLAIFSSNLDEFFEIRVAGLTQQVDSGVASLSPDGLTPREQLRRIHAEVERLVAEQYRCWEQQLIPALARADIFIRPVAELTRAELAWVRKYFHEQIHPVLTPLGLDQAHPTPQVGNKTLNIAVSLDNPTTTGPAKLVAILPVPRSLPRLVALAPVRNGARRYLFLSEIIKLCAGELFSGYRLTGTHAFRVTRNSDLYIDDEEAENLLQRIEEELRNRRRGAAVRLEIEAGMPDRTFATLCERLELPRERVFRFNGPLNLSRLMSLTELERPDLKYAPLTPVNASPLADPARIFSALRQQDVLLHHPYDSFNPVVDFVAQAARDPQVMAVKQTLYRTSGDSPIVRALMEAARAGKQVTVLVELKARFDEANNIQWARQLEEAGAHVVYGMVGYKTHCKVCLIVRREGGRMRRYAHFGSGNYNQRTARLYTDLSLFTSRASLTGDAAQLFNVLTGFSLAPKFRHLMVAPYNLQPRIIRLINRETRNAAAGRPARIMAKMNALVEPSVIDRLYAASRAGVKIDLVVRGICCLVPGVKGRSETIRVRSLVGRFLEHARTFYFENSTGSRPQIFSGSADWMQRNFRHRVEVLFPVEDPGLRQRIVNELFAIELADNVNASELQADGTYQPPPRRHGEAACSAPARFIAAAYRRASARAATPAPADIGRKA